MHVALLVLVNIFSFVTSGSKQPCRKWPSYGLCPFQPYPGDIVTLFTTALDEDCKDYSNNERFVPCLFPAGFSCIMAFFNTTTVISGCIRDSGSKLVTFQKPSNDSDVVEVMDLQHLSIRKLCTASDNCSPSEVSMQGRKTSLILNVCCCKGEHCTDPKAYDVSLANGTESEYQDLPFTDLSQLYILTVCYATMLAAITVNFCLSLYSMYCNKVIMKNQ